MRNTNPLGRLFVRYLTGQIEESVWKRFLSALEAFESNPSERSALIAFFDDAFVGTGKQRASQLDRLLTESIKA